MTAAGDCPELEQLFDDLAVGSGPALDHARACELCSGLLEEHRQLEKDLYRLADPLPPPDFVHRVMAKVAAAPVPIRSELKIGLSILVFAVAGAVATFLLADGSLGSLGIGAARTLVGVHAFAVNVQSLLSILWKTAAIPTALSLSVVLMLSLVFLKRLAGTQTISDVKVSP